MMMSSKRNQGRVRTYTITPQPLKAAEHWLTAQRVKLGTPPCHVVRGSKEFRRRTPTTQIPLNPVPTPAPAFVTRF